MLEDIHYLARQIEQYCFDENFMPKVLFNTSQLATVKELIEINYGISILPSIAIDQDPKSSIRFIKLKDKVSREVVLATAKDRYFSPAAEFFITTVKQQYKQ